MATRDAHRFSSDPVAEQGLSGVISPGSAWPHGLINNPGEKQPERIHDLTVPHSVGDWTPNATKGADKPDGRLEQIIDHQDDLSINSPPKHPNYGIYAKMDTEYLRKQIEFLAELLSDPLRTAELPSGPIALGALYGGLEAMRTELCRRESGRLIIHHTFLDKFY